MEYLLLKWLHVISATILFGTGIGIAFFKWSVDRSGDARAIAVVMRRVVLADWLFTAPAVVLQLLTGLRLAALAGYPLESDWIVASLALYGLAGACWLPVVWLQVRMRDIAGAAAASGEALPEEYRRLARAWFRLGVPAFASLLAVFWLMLAKPELRWTA